MPELAQTLPEGLEPEGDTWAYIAMPGQVANSLAYLTTLVDECKLHIEEQEEGLVLSTTHVDPANVGMGEVTLRLDSDLGIYEADTTGEFTTGIQLPWLRERLTWARVGRGGLESGDDVHLLLDKSARKARVQVERAVTRTSSIGTIDPDTVRQEPEVPDLALECKATGITHNQFWQAVQAAYQCADHARVTGRVRDGAGDLIIESQGDVMDEEVAIPEVAYADDPIEEQSSLFSVDYLQEMAKALHRAKMERLSIAWGDEWPTRIHYQHPEWGLEGTFTLAPRIQSD